MNLEDRVARSEQLARRRAPTPKLWHWLVVMLLIFAPIEGLYVLKRFVFPNTPTIYLMPILLPFVVIGFIFLKRINKQHPPGCCSTCGYDLTGNVSGKCPECGTALSGGQS